MPLPDITEQIKAYLNRSGWIQDLKKISFLAAGEYNANYRITTPALDFVFRINHGSQLGLGKGQIAYEFRVLRALEDSGVTPRPFECDPDAPGLGNGVLLMEFLPGRPLEYGRDLFRAADIFARIHTLPLPCDLITQADPIMEIAQESRSLIQRFSDHPLNREKNLLLAYLDKVLEIGDSTRELFREDPLCMVNTEVNSGNFIITPDRACLVDWEKAVVSFRYQDLGHFLVPTTTLWKTDTILKPEETMQFLTRYHRAAGLDMDIEELAEKTRILEKAILLRALSWCFMAYYEYTQTERALGNFDTFNKIKQYLADIPWILNSVT